MNFYFEDIYGYTHITTSEIARGGQGAVFRTQNPNIAVKVEFDNAGTEFCKDVSHNEALEELRMLPILKKVNITLPQATLMSMAGYVMTLLDDMDSFETVFSYNFNEKCEYENEWLESFGDDAGDSVNMFGQYILSGGRRRRLQAYLKAAAYLAEIHGKGLVYCDFSSKNVFVSKDAKNSEVWLIDADNLNYQDFTKHFSFFTPGYGAPEVVAGKGCTFYSDCYAFAVSLFWQLVERHPFRGALMEEGFDEDDFVDDAEERANAGEFPWILDEEDDRNAVETPIPQELVLTDRTRKLFGRTFSNEGKSKRQTRPSMFEWSYSLAMDFDNSVKCSHCEMDYDASFDECPWCDSKNKIVKIVSTKNKKVWEYAHELVEGNDYVVPLRLLKGYRAEEIDKKSFCIGLSADFIVISQLNENYEWSISQNEDDYSDIYGRVRFKGDCKVKCKSKASNETIEIEVRIR